ncbi:MAG: transaldolase, partial [Spirochaetia bacterium]|nr:transaldolase [Spirochaetia bacterium]
KVLERAKLYEEYRQFTKPEGSDGLDAVRHNLRVLRQANLPDTRLIICSMEGDRNYPDIDKLLAEPEFLDMTRKVVITTEPAYLVKWTTTPQVVTYQRRFMNAASTAK